MKWVIFKEVLFNITAGALHWIAFLSLFYTGNITKDIYGNCYLTLQEPSNREIKHLFMSRLYLAVIHVYVPVGKWNIDIQSLTYSILCWQEIILSFHL